MAEADIAKNFVITGATGGLGSALALALAERGARVILLDRRRKALEALCDRVEALGAPAPGYGEVDLARTGPEAIGELIQGLVDAYGGLDGLVHCAARFEGLRPLDQISPEDWLMDVQVNLNAAWLLTAKCIAHLKPRHGQVVFLTDKSAQGSAYWGSYGVSKGALESLASILSEELEGTGCSVTAIDPGPLRTDLRAAAYMAEDPSTIPHPAASAERLATLLLGDEGRAEKA